MITKEEFIKFIKAYEEFEEGINNLGEFLSGDRPYGVNLWDSNWVDAVCKMWDQFIYSHFTALYLHNIVGTIRGKYDLTITNEYHNPLLKDNNLYFVNDEVYKIGKEKVKTKCGNTVMCYNLERTICDLIRSIKRLNEHDVNIMVKRYLKDKNCNLKKLYDYAKKMNIYDQVYEMISSYK